MAANILMPNFNTLGRVLDKFKYLIAILGGPLMVIHVLNNPMLRLTLGATPTIPINSLGNTRQVRLQVREQDLFQGDFHFLPYNGQYLPQPPENYSKLVFYGPDYKPFYSSSDSKSLQVYTPPASGYRFTNLSSIFMYIITFSVLCLAIVYAFRKSARRSPRPIAMIDASTMTTTIATTSMGLEDYEALVQHIRDERDAAREEKKHAEEEVVIKTATLKESEARAKDLERQLEIAASNLEAIKSAQNISTEKLAGLQTSYNTQQKALDAKSQGLADAKKEIAIRDSAIRIHVHNQQVMQDELDDVNAALTLLDEDRKLTAPLIPRANERIEKLNLHIASQETQRKSLEENSNNVKAENKRLKLDIQGLKSKNQTIRVDCRRTERMVDTLRGELADMVIKYQNLSNVVSNNGKPPTEPGTSQNPPKDQDTPIIKNDTSGSDQDGSSIKKDDSGDRDNKVSVTEETASVEKDTNTIRNDDSDVKKDQVSGEEKDKTPAEQDESIVKKDGTSDEKDKSDVKEGAVPTKQEEVSGTQKKDLGVKQDDIGNKDQVTTKEDEVPDTKNTTGKDKIAVPSRSDTPSQGQAYNALAVNEFRRQFPNMWKILPASPHQNLCGLDSIVKSMESMHADSIEIPTVDELKAMLQTQTWKEIMSAASQTNEDFFGIDQLSLILNLWGQEKQTRLPLRVGCLESNKEPVLMHAELGDHTQATTVWIHHNGVDHYDGMARDGVIGSNTPDTDTPGSELQQKVNGVTDSQTGKQDPTTDVSQITAARSKEGGKQPVINTIPTAKFPKPIITRWGSAKIQDVFMTGMTPTTSTVRKSWDGALNGTRLGPRGPILPFPQDIHTRPWQGGKRDNILPETPTRPQGGRFRFGTGLQRNNVSQGIPTGPLTIYRPTQTFKGQQDNHPSRSQSLSSNNNNDPTINSISRPADHPPTAEPERDIREFPSPKVQPLSRLAIAARDYQDIPKIPHPTGGPDYVIRGREVPTDFKTTTKESIRVDQWNAHLLEQYRSSQRGDASNSGIKIPRPRPFKEMFPDVLEEEQRRLTAQNMKLDDERDPELMGPYPAGFLVRRV